MRTAVPEYYPRPEIETRHCAICYYHDTGLTTSLYVIDCGTAEAAFEKVETYFFDQAARVVLCTKVKRIEILPMNAELYSGTAPAYVKEYENPSAS